MQLPEEKLKGCVGELDQKARRSRNFGGENCPLRRYFLEGTWFCIFTFLVNEEKDGWGLLFDEEGAQSQGQTGVSTLCMGCTGVESSQCSALAQFPMPPLGGTPLPSRTCPEENRNNLQSVFCEGEDRTTGVQSRMRSTGGHGCILQMSQSWKPEERKWLTVG